MPRIVRAITHDVRFPTSRDLDGSDAMNPDPDYSAAYVVLDTDEPGLAGHGFTFTIGRGNELCVARDRARSRRASSARRSTSSIGDLRGMLATPRHRQPAALARAGEGRRPPGHGAPWSTRSGTSRAKRERQAAVAAARGPDAGAARRARRLPLPRATRSRPTRRSRCCAAPKRGRAERERAAPRGRLSRRTRRRRAGSAIRTRSCPAACREAVDDGYTHVKLKVGARPRRRHAAVRASPARRSGRTCS